MSRRTDPPRYWFPVKQRGLGWGPPCSWEGWATLAAYLLALPVTYFAVHPQEDLFVLLALLYTAILLLICVVKGEPLHRGHR